MAAKKAAGPSADELVSQALVRLATADGPLRITGKGDPPALFASAGGASKEAIARLKDGGLVREVGTGKAAPVELTAAGFRHVLAQLPADQIGGAALRIAESVPAAERVEFLNDVVRRTPEAAAELLPVLESAVAAERAEAEARITAAAKRREQEEANRKAMERWLELSEQRHQQRIDALQRELEAEGATPPPAVAPPPRPVEPEGEAPAPHTGEDRNFQRDVAGRLVSAWLESYRLNKPEGRLFLETAMGNVGRLRQIGEEGERVAFDGKYHDADVGVSSGTPVRVVRPGWLLDEDDGSEYRLVSAKVSP
jgi:hypothetical protein